MKACIGVMPNGQHCEVRHTCVKWLHMDMAAMNIARMYACPTDKAGRHTMYQPAGIVIPIKCLETERRAAV